MSKQQIKNYIKFYSQLNADQLATTIDNLESALFAETQFGKLANTKVVSDTQAKLELAKQILTKLN